VSLDVRKPGGDAILQMSGWDMAPHTVNGEKTFRVGATFIPMGVDVQSTAGAQTLREIRVYPCATANFTLYDDDGVSYDYEAGKGSTTRLHSDEKAQQLTARGAPPGHAILRSW
jgi:alpha-D-xyloside xylohydrolase